MVHGARTHMHARMHVASRQVLIFPLPPVPVPMQNSALTNLVYISQGDELAGCSFIEAGGL